MNLIDDLKKKLIQAAQIKQPYKRSVLITAVIAKALQEIGQDPILVGGTAVEFYTQGGYSTADIDMLSEGGPELAHRMIELGFKKLGKDFIHEKLKIYIEFPGRSLGMMERFRLVNVEEMEFKIISVEDLIVDRLAAFKFWKSAIDGINVLLLLEMDDLDETHLEQRAQTERVLDALEALKKLREEVIRKKLSKEKANQLLKKVMKELK